MQEQSRAQWPVSVGPTGAAPAEQKSSQTIHRGGCAPRKPYRKGVGPDLAVDCGLQACSPCGDRGRPQKNKAPAIERSCLRDFYFFLYPSRLLFFFFNTYTFMILKVGLPNLPSKHTGCQLNLNCRDIMSNFVVQVCLKLHRT